MTSSLEDPYLVGNHFLPGDLEAQIKAFADHHNQQRNREILNTVTAADVYFGRDRAILEPRETIKQKAFKTRRLHRKQHTA